MDSNNKHYGFISKERITSSGDCAKWCGNFPSADLVGFEWHLYNVQPCFCLYSYGQIPTPLSGTDWEYINTEEVGTGLINDYSQYPNVECFAFYQVRNWQHFPSLFDILLCIADVIPQGTSHAPTPAAVAYSKFGDGEVRAKSNFS